MAKGILKTILAAVTPGAPTAVELERRLIKVRETIPIYKERVQLSAYRASAISRTADPEGLYAKAETEQRRLDDAEMEVKVLEAAVEGARKAEAAQRVQSHQEADKARLRALAQHRAAMTQQAETIAVALRAAKVAWASLVETTIKVTRLYPGFASDGKLSIAALTVMWEQQLAKVHGRTPDEDWNYWERRMPGTTPQAAFRANLLGRGRNIPMAGIRGIAEMVDDLMTDLCTMAAQGRVRADSRYEPSPGPIEVTEKGETRTLTGTDHPHQAPPGPEHLLLPPDPERVIRAAAPPPVPDRPIRPPAPQPTKEELMEQLRQGAEQMKKTARAAASTAKTASPPELKE